MVFQGSRWRSIRLLLAAGLYLGISGCAASTSSTAAENRNRLSGGEHADVDISKAPRTSSKYVIELELSFATRNKPQFDELMRKMDDRNSPNYHRWLTPEEMHKRFGESQAEFDAVLQWLTSQGFTITDKAYGQNQDYIQFKGTVAQVEDAFKVRLYSPMPDRYMTNDDAAIPPQFVGVISSITGFAGLLQLQ
jgi:subtilase family serine protease